MNNWYLVRYLNGQMVDRSPYGLELSEAENILKLSECKGDIFTYKIERSTNEPR